MKGHRDVITDCVIIDDEAMLSNISNLGKIDNFENAFNNNKGSVLVSTSKDSLVKVILLCLESNLEDLGP